MKSSTEIIKAADDAAFRLTKRNICEKQKDDRYILGARDGYISGYFDGVTDNINLDKACEWLAKMGFVHLKEFRKAMQQ